MIKTHLSLVLVDGFFAIHLSKIIIIMKKSHNPYFNRWFSAIEEIINKAPIDELVTILILIDSFLQWMVKKWRKFIPPVTILILIDGFLQYINIHNIDGIKKCHNPYFNRWFSAMGQYIQLTVSKILSHNPYFNRWFSAI